MKRRILSIFCALALCLSLLPATVLATNGDVVATVTIGDQTTEYKTSDSTTPEAALRAAWNDCQSKTAKLTLKQSVTLTQQLKMSSTSTDLTLCMDDGVTLTSTYSGNDGFLYVQGSLNFQSGTIQANTTVSDFRVIWLYSNSAAVTLSGGNIEVNGNGQYGVYITQGTFNMTGGTITATGSQSCGVRFSDGNASANISGGTISAGRYGINAGSGNLKISGGATISSDNMYAMYVNNTDVQLSGGTYSGASGSIWAFGSTVGALLLEGYAYYDTDDNKIEETNVAKLENYKTVTVKSDSAGELTITAQPIGKNAEIGGSATFEVEVSGATDPSYQWEVSEDNGVTWTPIQGANQATLTISNATLDMAGNLYHCVVSDGTDSSVTLTSASAILTVNNCYRLTVIGGTGSGTYAPGAEVTISAPVEDNNGGYFWKWASDGVTISSPSTITNTFKMPSGNVTVTARYSDVIAIDGYMTKEEFVAKAEALLNEKVSSDVTWTNTINSDTYITEADSFTFTAKEDSNIQYGIMARQTMVQIDMGSKVGEGNWNYDEDTKTLTVTAGGKSYEVSFGTTGIKACENYVYVPTDALVTYKNADDETGYRLNMTITGENAENAYPVLVSGSGYKYVEDYEKSAGSAVISPESYLTDAKTGQSEYAIPVLIDKYGAINVWFSQLGILLFDGAGDSYSITFNGDAGNGRTYQMSAVSGNTFGNLGRVFFEVTPPDVEERAWAVLIVPTDQIKNDSGSGVTIDTSWKREYINDFTNGHSYLTYSLFQNSADQFAAVYLENDTTAVISEIKLTENQTGSVAPGGTAELSVTAEYQYKDRMPGVIYQWYKCDKDGRNPQEISGANAATYTTSNLATGEYYYFVTAQFAQFEESNSYFDEYGNKFLDNASYGWASDTVTTSNVITVAVGDAVDLTATVDKTILQAGETLTVDATVTKADGAASTATPTGNITLYWGDPTNGGVPIGSEVALDNNGHAQISYAITQADVESGPDKTLYIRYSGDENYRSATTNESIHLVDGLTITATPQDGQVTVTWNKPTELVTGYKLWVGLKEGFVIGPNPIVIDKDKTSVVVDKLPDGTPFQNGTTYTFYMEAYYDGGKVESNTAEAMPNPVYGITIETDGNGTAASSPSGSATVGSVVTLTATPDSGYYFVRWEVVSGNVTISNNCFTMPAADVTVKAVFASVPINDGGGTTAQYKITVEDAENGKVTSSHSWASQGITVTLTVTPDEGYELASLTITKSNGDEVQFTDNGSGKITFTMPASNVKVTAVFRAAYDACPRDNTCPIWPFTDASPTAWYHDGVHYCLANGLMEGVSDTLFAPNASMTRAMVWAILARLDGETITGSNWAETARAWAMENGVSDGTDPMGAVTREQLVTMLWRYAGSETPTGSLTRYPDYASISDWAGQAMLWATVEGIIEGDENGLINPTATATRAQAATILMRFCEG